jgi:hypothetical protein
VEKTCYVVELEIKKKIFFNQCVYFSFQHSLNQCILSQLNKTALLCFSKIPYTLTGFEPGYMVLPDWATLARFLKITEVAQMFVAAFYRGKSYALIVTKKGWASFWAIFSQTRLVTLAP